MGFEGVEESRKESRGSGERVEYELGEAERGIRRTETDGAVKESAEKRRGGDGGVSGGAAAASVVERRRVSFLPSGIQVIRG